jgi:hypothetical protein
MVTVKEYGSGRILKDIRLAHFALGIAGIPIVGPVFARRLEQRMQPLGLRQITLEVARSVIDACGHCAAGPRICQPLFHQSAASGAVFLDELADRLVAAGKARPVIKEQAKAILAKYPDNPLILSRVSGRYLEICRSDPKVCIYWKMRRGGLNV